jgi:nucleotide-binding universal stress UspA family protein
MYQHILIPTDGSELAERAVTHGLSLAKLLGAKVTVIIVEEQPRTLFTFPGPVVGGAFGPVVGGAFVELTEQIKKYAASALDRAADAAKQAGVPCETVQVQDVQPYEAIIATATDRGCDLIVMASHGRSGLSAVVLGSVTNKVLTHAKTHVLVCQ